MTTRILAGAALALGLAGAAQAQPADPALKGLSDCAAVADVAAKAACYDTATAALNAAVKSGDVIIVQRKQAQEAQRNAFGFNLPSLNIFNRALGGGGEKDSKDGKDKEGRPVLAESMDSLTSSVKRASQDGLGKWVLEITDGAVWQQTDNEVLAPRPKPGDKIEIKKGPLGNFMMKVGNGKAVRAKRVS
jgi:hypothetical protein